MPMTLLCIETATANRSHPASLALLHDGQQTQHTLEPHAQAAQLVGSIEALLNQHTIWYQDLTQLAITVGPGSFTGIRIGLAVARSIAFACPALRLTAISTAESMIAAYEGDAQALRIILRAGKGEVYHQPFARSGGLWHETHAISLCAPDQVPPDLPLFGNGMGDLSHELSALTLAAALQRVKLAPRECVPLYIRPPDALLPKVAFAEH